MSCTTTYIRKTWILSFLCLFCVAIYREVDKCLISLKIVRSQEAKNVWLSKCWQLLASYESQLLWIFLICVVGKLANDLHLLVIGSQSPVIWEGHWVWWCKCVWCVPQWWAWMLVDIFLQILGLPFPPTHSTIDSTHDSRTRSVCVHVCLEYMQCITAKHYNTALIIATCVARKRFLLLI